MKSVLVVSSIFPVEEISHKKNENDILFIIQDKINERYQEVHFQNVFIFPISFFLLSFFSKKWSEYYDLSSKKFVLSKGKKIWTIPLILLPKKFFFRELLLRVSLYLYSKRWRNVIKEFNPDILHAQDADVSASICKILSKKYNIPYIISCREINKGVDTIMIDNVRKSSFNLCLNKKQYDLVCQYAYENEKLLLPHGVGSIFYYDRVKHCDENAVIDKPIKLVTISRLLKGKNIDILIKALSTYNGVFTLDIYGDGPEMSNLKEVISDLKLDKVVSMKGFVNNIELPNILKECDLFILLSYPETLGRVYLEALASSVPIVGVKEAGLHGIISNNTCSRFLDLNEEDINIQLISFIDELSYNSESYWLSKSEAYKESLLFKWDNIVKQYVEVYQMA